MNNILEDYFAMFLKVRNHFANNGAAYLTITALTPEITSFNTKVDALMVLMANSTTDTTGTSIDKAAKRNTLSALALKISNALTAHAVAINDQNTRKKADYPTSYFTVASSEDLIARCKGLSLLAGPFAMSLVPYGVSGADLTAFTAALDAFVLADPNVSIAIDVRKENLAFAEIARQDIMNQLVNKIDVYARVLESTNAFVYALYKGAREIDNSGTPTSPDFEGSVTGPLPVELVELVYSANREFRLQVEGGNAIWGLSTIDNTIQYSAPIAPGDNPRLKSSTIGPNGDHLMLQAVVPTETITYKLWVYED